MFFKEAVLDVDGTLVGTDSECKQGIDITYNGTWGYHPLLISLANTAEPLYLINRSVNRPRPRASRRDWARCTTWEILLDSGIGTDRIKRSLKAAT